MIKKLRNYAIFLVLAMVLIFSFFYVRKLFFVLLYAFLLCLIFFFSYSYIVYKSNISKFYYTSKIRKKVDELLKNSKEKPKHYVYLNIVNHYYDNKRYLAKVSLLEVKEKDILREASFYLDLGQENDHIDKICSLKAEKRYNYEQLKVAINNFVKDLPIISLTQLEIATLYKIYEEPDLINNGVNTLINLVKNRKDRLDYLKRINTYIVKNGLKQENYKECVKIYYEIINTEGV